MRGIPDINFAPECSLRAKNPVARITRAGQDVAVAVELAVDGGGVDRDVRLRRLSPALAGSKLSA